MITTSLIVLALSVNALTPPQTWIIYLLTAKTVAYTTIAATFDWAMTYASATQDVQEYWAGKAQYEEVQRAKALTMTTETAPQSVLKTQTKPQPQAAISSTTIIVKLIPVDSLNVRAADITLGANTTVRMVIDTGASFAAIPTYIANSLIRKSRSNRNTWWIDVKVGKWRNA